MTGLNIYLYDGTFDGLLSAIFESYRLQAPAHRFVREFEWQESIFEEPVLVSCRADWAKRVRSGVSRKASPKAVSMLYRCFLSEYADAEMLIYHFVRLAMSSPNNIEDNFRDEAVLRLHQIDKQMKREVHRMHAFVRFQRTRDDIYCAVIDPDFDVLPLITDHFEKRYPAQEWLIYDFRRHYGMHFDQRSTRPVTFDPEGHQALRRLNNQSAEAGELDYQKLWQVYFKHTNIPERRNPKLHLQHVPRRYWKYLVEKSPDDRS